MTTLILWEMNESLIPSDPEEGMKLHMTNLQRVKEGVETGRLKWQPITIIHTHR